MRTRAAAVPRLLIQGLTSSSTASCGATIAAYELLPSGMAQLLRAAGAVAVVLWLLSPTAVWPQSIVATIPVGLPQGLAVNTVINKIYVDPQVRPGPERVTVIDGTTDSATDIWTTCRYDGPVAVNEVTNKLYDVCS